ncbi:MAG: hypothetical protein M0P59_05745 [Gallionella sp.]|jgi:hypothetical protein|nr:hypothetical protein [Gallionella sp.]MCK9353645.1 hypothetical protein [Gallionella sp.]
MQRELRFLLGYYSDLDAEPSADVFFVNLVRDNMATLTAATHREGGLSPQDGTKLAEAMANIGHAAEAMGYPVVKAMLDGIGTELPRKGKSFPPKRRAKIAEKLSTAQTLIRDMVCLAETGAI